MNEMSSKLIIKRPEQREWSSSEICCKSWTRFLSHHFINFRGYSPYGSSGIANKIASMTLQDHVNKGSGDFMEGNSSLYIPTLLKLIAIDIMIMDIQLF